MWLLVCCACVAATLVVGGVTRLTRSGLSIVEWRPVLGALPPMSDADWDAAFAAYKQTPEFQLVNYGMSLDEFRGIFWWEWVHRFLARAIGVVFGAPLVWFVVARKLDRALALRLAAIFALGGAQGAMGWYMVKSGLVADPKVSQYRLAVHLGLAFAIHAAMLWTALSLLAPRAGGPLDAARRSLLGFALGLTGLVFVMVLSGAIAAGLHACIGFNTFPLMNGRLVPRSAFVLEPLARNFFENPTTAQLDHRVIAWLLALLVPVFWLRARRLPLDPRARLACHLLLAALALQVSLGIATLLLYVPIAVAAAHQAGALVFFSAALYASHEVSRARADGSEPPRPLTRS